MRFSTDTCWLSDCGQPAVATLGDGVLLCQVHVDRLEGRPAHLEMLEEAA